MYTALLTLFVAVQAASPDTLVVCPPEFRPALSQWLDYRQRQGHRILVVPPAETTSQMQATIRRIGVPGRLRYLVLIGDVPAGRFATAAQRLRSVPTSYVPATVNTRWGSELTIATDTTYGDVDGNGTPDLIVGRIPADSATELAEIVRKIIRYEVQMATARSPQRLQVTSGFGGFGMVTDALVEATAQRIARHTVPADCMIVRVTAHVEDADHGEPARLATQVRQQVCEPGLAWVYLGHGRPTELDRIRTATGTAPLLSVTDIAQLSGNGPSPLAVLVACYTGAIDSQPDCLAEELLVAEQGPVAVIAATRVTMPYGNTVLGYELLRASFQDRPATLGEILQLAQRRTLAASSNDALRASLDQLARGISPPPVDLDAERREHVLMYQLLGDPLTKSPFTRAAGEAVASSVERQTRVK